LSICALKAVLLAVEFFLLGTVSRLALFHREQLLAVPASASCCSASCMMRAVRLSMAGVGAWTAESFAHLLAVRLPSSCRALSIGVPQGLPSGSPSALVLASTPSGAADTIDGSSITWRSPSGRT
jgi:hypothetical protein